VDTNFVNDLARKLADAVPGFADRFGAAGADLERNFRSLLAGAFERMDLVSREEFEVQRKVLERTREQLTAMESDLAALKAELRHDSSS
jgi:BMFP domain-containing protein YqiC